MITLSFTSVRLFPKTIKAASIYGCPVYVLFRDNGPVIQVYTLDKGRFPGKPEKCWDLVPAAQLGLYAFELEQKGYPKVWEILQENFRNIKPASERGGVARSTHGFTIEPGKARADSEYPAEMLDTFGEGALLGFNRSMRSRTVHAASEP